MLKWLILILIISLIYAFWRRSSTAGRRAGSAPRTGEAMVACGHCSLYIPAGEAHQGSDGRSYCCAQHGRMGPAQ